MVNTGRPSKACQGCRDRKIKCNQAKPACMQCVKARLICTGYRDDLDLLFCDQSRQTVHRARKKEAARAKAIVSKPPLSPPKVLLAFSSRPSSSSPSAELFPIKDIEWLDAFPDRTTGEWQSQLAPHQSIAKCLPTSLDDQAITFFIAKYCFGNADYTGGHFEYLPSFYIAPGKTADPCLSTSLLAVGLAALANKRCSSSMRTQARKTYISAIQMVNAALKSPTEAVKDGTLASVLLLGMFEAIMFENWQSIESWSGHVNGTALLVKLRGHSQFNTHLGRRMLQQTYVSILTSNFHNEEAVSDEIFKIRSHGKQFVNGDWIGWHFAHIVIRLIEFRASVKNGTITDPMVKFNTILQIDRDMHSLASSPGPAYETIITDTRSDLVYETFYHVYSDPWEVQVYNSLRTVRLFLHRKLIEQLHQAFAAFPALRHIRQYAKQLQVSKDVMVQMASDICASVPQFTGAPSQTQSGHYSSSDSGSSTWDEARSWGDARHSSPFDSISQDSRSSYSQGSAQECSAGCHFLLWPLFIAGRSSEAPEELRIWAANRLRHIERDIGIRHAGALADVLDGLAEFSLLD